MRFWMINHRPPIDESGNFLDATKLGGNSTVEVFDLKPGSTKLEYVKIIADPIIQTPNNIAATGDGGFVFTNDHSSKTGILRSLDVVLGSGNIASCGPDNQCHPGPSNRFPNGIVQGQDGLYYVASSVKGTISIYSLTHDSTLTQIDEIHVLMPLDNLSVDSNGDIFAVGFPDVVKLLKAIEDTGVSAPSTAFRIRRFDTEDEGSRYVVTKILEDIEAKFLHAATTVVHDPKTGSLFFGGVVAPYLVMCEADHAVKEE